MKKALLYLSAPLLLTGCATYHLSTESLMQQMAGTQPEKKYIYTFDLSPLASMGTAFINSNAGIRMGRRQTST
jgi:hypothetical protein